MKVIDNRKTAKITFRDIDVGEVFQTVMGGFFLKCYTVEGDENYYNCVNLENGTLDYCNELLECSPVKAKLVVERG